MDNIEEKFETKKGGKKGLIIAILILVIVAAAELCAYYLINSKPKTILKKYVNELLAEGKTEDVSFNTFKTNVNLSFKVKTDDSQTQEVFNELSKCTLKSEAQLDLANKKEIMGLGLTYDNQSVIDAKLVYDNKNIYTYLDGIYDKYIKLDANQEQLEQINQLFDDLKKQLDDYKKEDATETIKIVKTALIEKIETSESVSQEKTNITIDGKEKSVKKISIKLTTKELSEIMSKIYKDLANSKAYENNEEMKQSLTQVGNSLESLSNNTDNYVMISLYTAGIKNDLVGLNFTIYNKSDDMSIIFNILKKEKNTYTYTIDGVTQGSSVKFVNGEIKVEPEINAKDEAKNKLTITAEIPALITKLSSKLDVELVIDYHVKVNSEIDNIDISNSVNMNDISQEDVQSMYEKLQQRPLIGPILTMYSSNLNGLTDTLEGNL